MDINPSPSEGAQAPSNARRKIIAAVLILAIGFGAGFATAKYYSPRVVVLTGLENAEKGQPEKVDFSLFWDVYKEIEEKHYDRGNLDYKNILFGSIKGLVGSLGDPYTEFFPPKETERFIEDVRGTFEGIGAEIDVKDGILTVVAPLKGMPAEKAGLEAGDYILKIDDEDTEGITVEDAVNKIRGPRGTTVKLTIQRNDEELVFNIRRDTIRIPIITLEFKEDNVAYLRIAHFSENSATQFAQSVQEILKSGSTRLILDLRNNPGGFLDKAVEIASYFLPKGEIVTIEDFGPGKDQTLYPSQGYNQLGNMKMVVLVNKGSASASEIVAGALRDLKKTQLIGEKTFGKGSVQEFIETGQGTSLKVTVAKWLTPASHEIDGKGLEPDIAIEMGENPDQDLQLEKALEIVKNLP